MNKKAFSKPGIISFILSVIISIFYFFGFGVSFFTKPDVFGFKITMSFFTVSPIIYLIPLIIGIPGLYIKENNRIFNYLGTSISTFFLFLYIGYLFLSKT